MTGARRLRLGAVAAAVIMLFVVTTMQSTDTAPVEVPANVQTADVVVANTRRPSNADGAGDSRRSAATVDTAARRAWGGAVPEWGSVRATSCASSTVTLHRSKGSSNDDDAVTPATANSDAAEDAANSERSMCCPAVAGDIDLGRTMRHLISRLACETPPSSGDAETGAVASAARPRARKRPLRVMQVGANTGDNANDHLVLFLKLGVAHAVLLEPVPWLFKRLSKTYEPHASVVKLLNAAMTLTDGNVTFTAPKESARGWIPQMGGLELPGSSARKVQKMGWGKHFEKITVQGITFKSLMESAGWTPTESDKAAGDAGLDVFVVDAEGFDANIVNFVLDAVVSDGPQSPRVPVIQYEWKHLKPEVRQELKRRLGLLGYCVVQVHYDEIAYIANAVGLGGQPAAAACAQSFLISAV